MEYYNKSIANNPKVEFLLLSQDSKVEHALNWAESSKHPWFTIIKPQIAAAGLGGYYLGTPSYILIDSSGKVLATTEKQCMQKIKALTGR